MLAVIFAITLFIFAVGVTALVLWSNSEFNNLLK